MPILEYRKFKIEAKNVAEAKKIISEKFEENEYYIDGLSPNPIIFDVGSHIGLSVLYFLDKFPGCTVYAFEPEPTNFALLSKNISINNCVNVFIHNVAISDRNGETILLVPHQSENQSYWGGTLRSDLWGIDDPDNREITVKCKTLSSFIESEIDLLKLDIEGNELTVIKELHSANKLRHIKNIVIEYHGTKFNKITNSEDEILRYLKINGFCVEEEPVDLTAPPHSLSQEFVDSNEVHYSLIKAKRCK